LVLGISAVAIAAPEAGALYLTVGSVGLGAGKIMLDVTDWFWHGWRINNEN